jgi:hypothetical protein
VAHKGNAAGVRPQVAGTMENDNAIAKPLRRSADHRGTRLLTRLKFKLASRFGLRTHPCIGGPIVFVTAAAGLVHFIANNGEILSSTSQFHMENKSQFSESLGTSHRAG